MSKTKKVPNLRFQGFTDDWEQRKLGDLGSLKNGMNFSKDEMGIGFPFVNLQDIFGKSIVTKHSLGKAQASASQLRNYNLLKGDVLFVRSSVKLEGVGQAAVVPSDFINTTYSGFLIRFRDQNNLDDNFKSQTFKTRNIRTQIMSKATDSANKNISQPSLSKLKIVFPNKMEQEKIGKLFKDLDKTITLHQHKLDQLRVLKEILLQKLFANDQHDKPELRFKDFTDKWEKVKIGSLFTESTEKSATGQLLSVSINKGVYPFDETERKNNSSKNKSNYKFVEKYDIAYNSMRMWQGAEGVSYYSGIVSPAYTVLKPQQNSNPEFYAYMFKRAEMLNKFRRYSQGLTSDTWNLKFPILKTISLRTTDIKEQEKIVQLLRMVKDNISLQQKKLTQYQQAKKFLLQQMFI